jgi:mono/diheme cytochrome c family protein
MTADRGNIAVVGALARGEASGGVMSVFRWVVVAGILAFPVAAWAGQQPTAEQIAAGVKVYAAQKCMICHSIEGRGNKKGPLDGVGTKLSVEQIREWIVDPVEAATKAKSTAKPVMKAYKLASADLDALVAYMKSLEKK